MATRGTTKALSVLQEERIAHLYRGKRSKSSGAAAHDQGDVRTATELIECKYHGQPGGTPISVPRPVAELEKVAKEAWSEGREPVLALRYYLPDSILADNDGWVDLTVRRTCDDVELKDALAGAEDSLDHR